MNETSAARRKKPLPAGTAPDRAGRRSRHSAVNDHRRNIVLNAAKEVFQELGLDGAGIREIARRAGYTPGAIYFYYRSKEEIYGDILADSLERLHAAVAGSGKRARSPAARLLAQALAFFGFYAGNPRDLDLGFYLFRGMKPHGLTPELNARLNARLLDSLKPMEQSLLDLGAAPAAAVRETAALFGHCVGLLLLQHTGRIRLFKTAAIDLFEDYVRQLCRRAAGAGRDDACRKAL